MDINGTNVKLLCGIFKKEWVLVKNECVWECTVIFVVMVWGGFFYKIHEVFLFED